MLVLVVDDDRAVRQSLRVTLEYEGYQVIAASNGREGLELLSDQLPDVVLLDIRMPGISGLDLLGHLRSVHQALPVVMMSSDPTSAVRAAALAAGAVDVLEKPFESTDRLCATIRKAAEQARHVHEFRIDAP